jgi:RNA polymerase sigma-70 factor (ECF subfamily)
MSTAAYFDQEDPPAERLPTRVALGAAPQFVEGLLSRLDPGLAGQLRRPPFPFRLLEAWFAACQAWPHLDVAPDVFAPFLAQRIPPDSEPAQVVEARRMRELLLTCACARWNRRAIRLLDTRYLPLVGWTLRRLGLPAARVDEVRMLLLDQLIVGDGRGPGILRYSGWGGLRRWLSVSAVRVAHKLRRREQRESLDDGARLARMPAPDGDIEERHALLACGAEVKVSVREALARLDDRQRSILMRHYLDDWTLADIAARHRVHRATMARWLAAARDKLLRETHQVLRSRLRVTAGECQEVLETALRSSLTRSQLIPAREAW